jgi:hypothetical protein
MHTCRCLDKEFRGFFETSFVRPENATYDSGVLLLGHRSNKIKSPVVNEVYADSCYVIEEGLRNAKLD